MAAPYNPPKKGEDYIVYVPLQDFDTPGAFQASPTIAAGDFKVSKDDGALADLATLPTVAPAGSIWVKITLSATEMDADNVKVQCIDQTATPEWGQTAFCIQTTA